MSDHLSAGVSVRVSQIGANVGVSFAFDCEDLESAELLREILIMAVEGRWRNRRHIRAQEDLTHVMDIDELLEAFHEIAQAGF